MSVGKLPHGRSVESSRHPHCLCGEVGKRDDVFDAHYCPTSGVWLEKQCGDVHCASCADRPERRCVDPRARSDALAWLQCSRAHYLAAYESCVTEGVRLPDVEHMRASVAPGGLLPGDHGVQVPMPKEGEKPERAPFKTLRERMSPERQARNEARAAKMLTALDAEYEKLRADPKAWAEEEAERALWDTTSADGLEDEPPYGTVAEPQSDPPTPDDRRRLERAARALARDDGITLTEAEEAEYQRTAVPPERVTRWLAGRRDAFGYFRSSLAQYLMAYSACRRLGVAIPDEDTVRVMCTPELMRRLQEGIAEGERGDSYSILPEEMKEWEETGYWPKRFDEVIEPDRNLEIYEVRYTRDGDYWLAEAQQLHSGPDMKEMSRLEGKTAGAHTQGETLDEARVNILEVLGMLAEDLRGPIEELPPERRVVAFTLDVEESENRHVTDGLRWRAEVARLPGTEAYGVTRINAIALAQARALRVIAYQLEQPHAEMLFSGLEFLIPTGSGRSAGTSPGEGTDP